MDQSDNDQNQPDAMQYVLKRGAYKHILKKTKITGSFNETRALRVCGDLSVLATYLSY